MAKEDMEVGFTLGDQSRMIRMESTLNTLATGVGNLPCAHEPPICTQENRLASLETTRRRGMGGFITLIIGAIVAFIASLFQN